MFISKMQYSLDKLFLLHWIFLRSYKEIIIIGAKILLKFFDLVENDILCILQSKLKFSCIYFFFIVQMSTQIPTLHCYKKSIEELVFQ